MHRSKLMQFPTGNQCYYEILIFILFILAFGFKEKLFSN